MKKKRYREIYHNNVNTKKEKSTVVVEKKKDNIERERKGFNVFFDLRDEKKKSSDY